LWDRGIFFKREEVRKVRRKYLLFLLVFLVVTLVGCGRRRHVAPPPEPGAPFDLAAVVISCEQIDLTWKHIPQNEYTKGFYVYRKITGSYGKIAVLDSETTSYSDSPLSPETTYWYRVTAYGEGGESQPSNEVTATTPPEVEMLDYSWNETFYDWSQEWGTSARGNVKNNTSRVLTIQVKGRFFNYDDVVIHNYSTYLNNVDFGTSQSFYIYYSGERTKQVEAWIEDYY